MYDELCYSMHEINVNRLSAKSERRQIDIGQVSQLILVVEFDRAYNMQEPFDAFTTPTKRAEISDITPLNSFLFSGAGVPISTIRVMYTFP